MESFLTLTNPEGRVVMKMKTTKTVINGEPYTITPNEFGWGVTNTSRRINNVGRSYQVFASKTDGRPESCSCPHQTHAGVICKHMAEVSRQLRAAEPKLEPPEEPKVTEVSSHSLEHPSKPRLYRFGVMASGMVRYDRWERGVRTSSQLITIEAARKRWEYLVRANGYQPFGFMSKQPTKEPTKEPTSV